MAWATLDLFQNSYDFVDLNSYFYFLRTQHGLFLVSIELDFNLVAKIVIMNVWRHGAKDAWNMHICNCFQDLGT